MGLIPEVIADAAGRRGIDLVHDPLDTDGRIEDVSDSLSRASRIRSTAMFVSPCFSNISRRTSSDRS